MIPDLILYILITLTVLVSFFQNKRLELLNKISKSFTNNFKERQNYEVVMQPKWHLYVVILQILLVGLLSCFLYSKFDLFGLLYALGIYMSSGILSKIIPYPSKKYFLKLYFETTKSRIGELLKYTNEEIEYLTATYQKLFEMMKEYDTGGEKK